MSTFLPQDQLESVSSPDHQRTLVVALEQSFKQFESDVAIDTPDYKLTYAELDVLTSQVAAKLRSSDLFQHFQSLPVAILMSRSVELYVAQISVLRAGGFFLPIDPSQPADRIEFLLSDSQASLLLVREADSFEKPESTANQLSIDIDRLMEEKSLGNKDKTDCSDSGPIQSVDESDLAYMIYTSGSSGQPKGVPISHKAIYNLCDWWKKNYALPGNRASQMISVGFDPSLEEVFPTLVTGGTVVPIQPDTLDSIEGFLDFIRQQKINMLHTPTALWHTLAASLEMYDSLELPDCVRTVVFGGEQVDPHQVDAWFSKVSSDVRLINAYGPTETTIGVSYAALSPGVEPSIGKPIQGVSFSVVGEDGQLVEAGQPGELYIGGVCLATEYWNREQLSAEKFVSCAFVEGQKCYRTGDIVRLGSDGNYEFIGRVDDQIKLRGYRIELGEISTCLGAHPLVSQAHVAVRQFASVSQSKYLLGYVVAQPGEAPDEAELKEFLQQQLPAYMVPTRIVLMDSFPLTAGGKLALDQFPDPVAVASLGGDEGFLSETEERVAEVWKKVLGVSQLGREANFFHIGGDSLLAMRLVLMLESEFPGPMIPVAALIPNPTVSLMADYIDQHRNGSANSVSKHWPLLTRLGDFSKPISVVCLHAAGGGGMFYRELCDGLDSEISMVVLEAPALYQTGPVVLERQSVVEIAQDYVDCIIDAGCQKKLTLAGYSFGGLVAYEMAQLLIGQGFEIERIINIDSPNPQTIKLRPFLSRSWHRSQLPRTIGQRVVECKSILQRKWHVNEVEKRAKAKLPPPVALRSLALELEFVRIARGHVPEPCDVSMHLICGEDPEPKYCVPDDYGWSENVSELTTVQIPGGHNTIFDQPYLQALKAAFQAALTETL